MFSLENGSEVETVLDQRILGGAYVYHTKVTKLYIYQTTFYPTINANNLEMQHAAVT
jgi:hypothetical protein